MLKILRKTWISQLDLYLITSDWNDLDYLDVWLKTKQIKKVNDDFFKYFDYHYNDNIYVMLGRNIDLQVNGF